MNKTNQANSNIEKALLTAIILTITYFIIEIIGGLISGSLSLLSDAGHMLRDVLALFISLGALKLAKKIPSKTKTFGYHRIEIFSAFLNGLLLIVISVWILKEAFHRFYLPRTIESHTMFFVAVIGLIVNIYVAIKLHGSEDLNIKSAFYHVLTDTLSSAAVIFASIWIYFKQQYIIDTLLSVAISIFLILSAITLLKESIFILLEFTPRNIKFDDIIKDIETVAGVNGIHNVHLWSLCSNINVLDAHIYCTENDLCRIEEIKQEIKMRLSKYNI
ncbi:MAG: cation transporter, partial [Candidatus Fischerbacteria bacterium RBG_13_37_8]